MNNNNFFKKHFIEIMVILFIGILIIIVINKNRPHVTSPQTPLSSLEAEKEKFESEESEREKPISPRPKRSLEIPQPKIKTTASRFEQIKTYLFQETAHPAILPSDLSSEEQEKNVELKKSWRSKLNILKEQKTWVDEQQKNCDEYQSQLNALLPQIEALKPQKSSLEKEKAVKEQEINNLKQSDKRGNQDKIEKLKAERLEIIGEIGKINVQIGKLEVDQKSYQEMLNRAQNYKKRLEKGYEIDKKEFTNSILSELNSFYEITSAEG
ncbi:hypothetical protein OC683_02285 ['Crotalaria aegyptiaca' phytoplasma]|uniref:Uncharacterized protein n=2 Tax=Candidatus Phytoplasma crotalariae TaxID=2982627 RepID=A0ABT9D331_9MOLU|nr:hypothetical protein ['Crotalaria aegyptiaca' phytoplasma]